MKTLLAHREPVLADTLLVHPLILSGGAGTRLWPLSRAAFPKQLLALVTDRTLLQETALRTHTDAAYSPPIVACNDSHRFMIEEQLRQVGVTPRQILVEPLARNTAPAIAVAALWLADKEPDALMLVQPSDHMIGSIVALHQAVASSLSAAQSGHLVAFGIKPLRPEPGYGYIRSGPPLNGSNALKIVDQFIEKPDLERARAFAANRAFYWNSGIFLFNVRYLLEELERLHPKMLDACERALRLGKEDLSVLKLDEGAFGESINLSIDRAVMEHTDRAVVVPVEMEWSDVGSWRELRDIGAADEHGNTVHGDVVLDGVRNSYIRSERGLVAAIGLENIVVVATDDAILIADADHASEVSRTVDLLKQRNRAESTQHLTVYRPWGNYRQVDVGTRFQVKRITVKPGAALSLQRHYHRAEHWVVVQGTARVQRGTESFLLRENESIFIPIGMEHRLENPGKLPLHLIEVQSGAYLGEDDIVRLSDNYGRA